jgi:hypothetical protein
MSQKTSVDLYIYRAALVSKILPMQVPIGLSLRLRYLLVEEERANLTAGFREVCMW